MFQALAKVRFRIRVRVRVRVRAEVLNSRQPTLQVSLSIPTPRAPPLMHWHRVAIWWITEAF